MSASGYTLSTTGRSAPEVTWPARSRSTAVSGLALKVRMRREPCTLDAAIAARADGRQSDGDHPAALGQPAAVAVQFRADGVDDDVERPDPVRGGGAVVEDLVGAQVGEGCGVAVAGQRGDMAAHRVRQLHGGRADSAGRAPDQDPLAARQAHAVAQRDQRGGARDDQGGRLDRREAGRRGR